MRQLYGCQDTTRIQQLTARCRQIALLKRWHRASRQRVVDAEPVNDSHERCTTWRLRMSVPTTTSTGKTQRVSAAASMSSSHDHISDLREAEEERVAC